MGYVYVLHGFGGGELSTGAGRSGIIWADPVELAFGKVGKLRLAPDGINPGSPDGVQLYVGLPLNAYYYPAIDSLRRQLRDEGYNVNGWGYDWRLDLRTAGALLAADIRSTASASDPASIVAHSAAGLVARCCWASLLASGDSALVRRIVTLGTPHFGSYAIVGLWSDDDEVPEQLFRVTTGVTFASLITGILVPARVWYPRDTINLSATWPASYQLLPFLSAPDAADDPNRAKLFTQSNWPAWFDGSQAHFDNALASWQPFMTSATTLPPPWVLTTVAGWGVDTPYRLSRPDYLGDAYAYDRTEEGDGKVTVSSALLPNSARFKVEGRHGALPLDTATSGALADWIRDVRAAPSPAPPQVNVYGELGAALAGPPIPLLFSTGADP